MNKIALSFALGLGLVLQVAPPAKGSEIVEMSKTLEFSEVAIGESGTVAYWAESEDGSYRAIHRNGGPFVVEGTPFEELTDDIVVTNNGTVMFGAIHGEFEFQDTNPSDPPLRLEVAGVYKGPNPVVPYETEQRYQGDNVESLIERGEGRVLGFSNNGFRLIEVSGQRVRFPTRTRLCPNDTRGVYVTGAFGNRASGAVLVADINSDHAVGFIDDRLNGPFVLLYQYFRCGPITNNYDELRDATRDYFRGVGDINISQSNQIHVIGQRNLPPGSIPSSVAGVYTLSPSGSITIVRERDTSSQDAFAPIGITKNGAYAYRDTLPDRPFESGIFFSGSPGQPLIASGHQLGSYIVRSCGAGRRGVSSSGSVACDGRICRIDDEDDCYNAVIVASGGTDFPPDPNDPPPDEVRWSSDGSGDFDDGANWDSGSAPTSEQVAIFGVATRSTNTAEKVNPGSAIATPGNEYTVSFDGASRQSHRIKIESGDVNFSTGQYESLEDSGTRPGIWLETGARLDVENGHVLKGDYVTVGAGPVAGVGPAVIGVSGITSRLEHSARMIVGDFGRGQLAITDGGTIVSGAARIGNLLGSEGIVILDTPPQTPGSASTWAVGNLAVGYYGRGELRILEESNALTDNTFVGFHREGDGSVTVGGASVWINEGSLSVGASGGGDLTVREGSEVSIYDSLSVGVGPNSYGEVYVTGAEQNSGVTTQSNIEVDNAAVVAIESYGSLKINDGGRVTAESLITAQESESYAILEVSGPSSTVSGVVSELALSDALVIGLAGDAEALFDDSALVSSDYGVIGGGAEGNGLVTIRGDAGWDLNTTLDVGTASEGADSTVCDGDDVSFGTGVLKLQGDGTLADVTGQTLTVTGPDSRVSGTGTASFATTTLSNCGTLSPGNSPGTLTLNGNLVSRGGVLEIELFGLEAGQFDVLKVNGDAQFSGGIVKFIFRGFIPRQGDQITFLETDGSLTLAEDMRYEYQGANEGFEFTISTDEEGNVMFTADNDAVDQLFLSQFE